MLVQISEHLFQWQAERNEQLPKEPEAKFKELQCNKRQKVTHRK